MTPTTPDKKNKFRVLFCTLPYAVLLHISLLNHMHILLRWRSKTYTGMRRQYRFRTIAAEYDISLFIIANTSQASHMTSF